MKKTVLAAVLSMSSLLSINTMAADLSFPHLETQGSGEIVVQPDMAIFSIRVVETKATAKEAKEAADSAVAKFVERLTQVGVERSDINSANINLTPQYKYPKDAKPELTGYKASRQVTVTVHALDKLNTYLDDALGDGINRIDNIQLKVADEAKYQEQARQAAIKDAISTAKSLAQGFGDSLDGVWQISYRNEYRPQPYMVNFAAAPRSAMADEAAVNASYNDASIKIRDEVNVIFKLKDGTQ
ncbi:TPA: oxidative stress defense protein [Photobacterium damselae]